MQPRRRCRSTARHDRPEAHHGWNRDKADARDLSSRTCARSRPLSPRGRRGRHGPPTATRAARRLHRIWEDGRHGRRVGEAGQHPATAAAIRTDGLPAGPDPGRDGRTGRRRGDPRRYQGARNERLLPRGALALRDRQVCRGTTRRRLDRRAGAHHQAQSALDNADLSQIKTCLAGHDGSPVVPVPAGIEGDEAAETGFLADPRPDGRRSGPIASSARAITDTVRGANWRSCGCILEFLQQRRPGFLRPQVLPLFLGQLRLRHLGGVVDVRIDLRRRRSVVRTVPGSSRSLGGYRFTRNLRSCP